MFLAAQGLLFLILALLPSPHLHASLKGLLFSKATARLDPNSLVFPFARP